jgi:hypothetical protein
LQFLSSFTGEGYLRNVITRHARNTFARKSTTTLEDYCTQPLSGSDGVLRYQIMGGGIHPHMCLVITPGWPGAVIFGVDQPLFDLAAMSLGLATWPCVVSLLATVVLLMGRCQQAGTLIAPWSILAYPLTTATLCTIGATEHTCPPPTGTYTMTHMHSEIFSCSLYPYAAAQFSSKRFT